MKFRETFAKFTEMFSAPQLHLLHTRLVQLVDPALHYAHRIGNIGVALAHHIAAAQYFLLGGIAQGHDAVHDFHPRFQAAVQLLRQLFLRLFDAFHRPRQPVDFGPPRPGIPLMQVVTRSASLRRTSISSSSICW